MSPFSIFNGMHCSVRLFYYRSLSCLLTKFHKLGKPIEFPVWGRFLIIALLAKLMLESGIVKFTSFGPNNENTLVRSNRPKLPLLDSATSTWLKQLDRFIPLWFDHFPLFDVHNRTHSSIFFSFYRESFDELE